MENTSNKTNPSVQEIKVKGSQLVDKVRDLIDEGTARRVIIKKDDRIVMELPLSVGVGGAAVAIWFSPVLAAIGALAALMSDVTIIVERDPDAVSAKPDSERELTTYQGPTTGGGTAGTTGGTSGMPGGPTGPTTGGLS